jgi:hypothetical protein
VAKESEEKSHDRWFQKTKRNFVNFLKAISKEKHKHKAKQSGKRTESEETADKDKKENQSEPLPSVIPSSELSKMPQIREELSSSSSSSLSASPRQSATNVNDGKEAKPEESKLGSLDSAPVHVPPLKVTRSGEFFRQPNRIRNSIPYISTRGSDKGHWDSASQRRDYRRTLHVAISSSSFHVSESNLRYGKDKENDSAGSVQGVSRTLDPHKAEKKFSHHRHSLSAEFVFSTQKIENSTQRNSVGSLQQLRTSSEVKRPVPSEGVDVQSTTLQESKTIQGDSLKSSSQFTSSQNLKADTSTPTNADAAKDTKKHTADTKISHDVVLTAEEIEASVRRRALSVADAATSSPQHMRKEPIYTVTEHDHKKSRKRLSKTKHTKAADSDVATQRMSMSKHAKSTATRPHSAASPKSSSTHLARPLSAVVSSSSQSHLTGSHNSLRGDSFQNKQNIFFILSPEKENWYTENVEKVIKIQALIRGRRARKIYVMLGHRKNVAKEIVNSEENYVENLRKIIKLYKIPLQNNPQLLTSPADIKTIFSELDVILNYNSMMLGQLKERLSRWNHFQRLGDIFLRMTEFLKVYTQYVKNFNDALRQVSLCNQNREFREFLQKTREDPLSMNLTFIDFLVMPVQRIPRYVILLNDLLNCTPKSHEDYNDVKLAVEKLNLVCVYVNEKKRDAENLDLVLNVQEKLVPGKKGSSLHKNLAEAHRRYIREGYLACVKLSSNNDIITKSKHHYFILFNDLLLETKLKKGVLDKLTYVNIGTHPKEEKLSQKVSCKLIYIRDIKLDYESVVVENPISHLPNAFTVINRDGSFTFLCSTSTEKDEWVTAMKNNIATLIKNKQSQEADLIKKN